MRTALNQKAFTVIELLIATAVFSLVLIIFLSAFIKIGDMFYKGVNMSNTQEAARIVLDDISSDIRFSKSKPYPVPLTTDASGMGFFCIGQHRYKYYLDKQVGDPGTPFGLMREDVSGGGCQNPNVQTGTNPTELLNSRMQLNRMDLSCASGSCRISILVVFYGNDSSVLVPSPNDPKAACSGGITTSQFCATADYVSTVNEQN